MSGYNDFAYYYDALTFNVDYDSKFKYICECMTRLNHDFGLSLDLACGTGTLTLIMKKAGIDVFGVDSSVDMLSVAVDKMYEEDENILFVNQKMQELLLPYKIDTCVCTLDAINHLADEKDVKKTFENIYNYLNDDGVFIFDVNTIYKHEKILANNTFTYDVDDVYLLWKNKINDNHIVDINLEFTLNDGSKYFEKFSERAYDLDDIKHWLKKIGFKKIQVFNYETFDEPNEDSEKVYFIVKR